MRALLLSDIQGNLPAFETVLQNMIGEYDEVWYLGDIVGSGPYPNECVELLESLNPVSVVGNEDWLAIEKYDLDDFTEEARRLRVWVREQLSDKSCNYLSNLPEKLVQENDFTLVHGSVRHPVWEYVLYPKIAQASFESLETTCCFMGHSLATVVFEEESNQDKMCRAFAPGVEGSPIEFGKPIKLGKRRLMINPGGGGREKWGYTGISHYGILDTEAKTFEFKITRANQKAYDEYKSAFRQLKQALNISSRI